MNIKTNDNVKIIAGKDRGKIGKVVHVSPKEGRVVVENVNIVKRHLKPKRQGEKGQIAEIPKPIDVSNVMVVCSTCKKTTRASKSRLCKKCGASV